ncbi:MAG TPA: B12-binding domain-containing radical SAM protein [Lachnospiraceae bacterium]|nr:B12-binding domain-containing radical SAM protein [Lachnospiraceae bacterium]
MRILLAAINAKYIHSNLAVYSLRAYAKPYREKIRIAEYTINQPLEEILMDLYRQGPDLLCFSCYIWNIELVGKLIRELRKVLPDTRIWAGGPEVSYDSREFLLRYPEASGVMKGEGEETFLALLEYWSDGEKLNFERSPDAIEGITWRAADGTIAENPWRPVMDLSRVPFIYEDLELFRNKILYYESSRGCPFRCSYCLSSVDKCLRFRGLELVKRELQFFLDHKVPQVKFVDRTFNCRHEHALAVWQYLKEHDNGITNFHFEISADLLNEEELELIASMRPGLIQLEIGVQSTNPETIREIRRTMRFDKVADTVKRLNQMENVHQHLDLIAGLPYEDYESFGRSFDEVYALRPEQLQLGFLKVLKGSEMEQRKEEYGLICQDRPPYEVLYTRWLPYSDIIRLKGVEEMVEAYYNSGQFGYTLEKLVEEFVSPFRMYEELRDYYEAHTLTQVSHSRVTRYELLLAFIGERVSGDYERYRELLTLDYYLRENAKNRPDFAGAYTVEKEWLREFYDTEAEERQYLKDYTGYDTRQLRRMTHVERFTHLVQEELYLLFDYQNRSPLNHQAAVYRVAAGDPAQKK